MPTLTAMQVHYTTLNGVCSEERKETSSAYEAKMHSLAHVERGFPLSFIKDAPESVSLKVQQEDNIRFSA